MFRATLVALVTLVASCGATPEDQSLLAASDADTVKLLTVFRYERLGPDARPTTTNRAYFEDGGRATNAPNGWGQPAPAFKALASAVGAARLEACQPKQLIQCYRRTAAAFYLAAEGCRDGATDDEVYRLAAFVCAQPVAGKTRELRLYGHMTLGTAAAAEPSDISYLVFGHGFVDQGLIGYVPVDGF